ncbi:hypothetical protein IEE_05057, partial [Bacillus cereus BAG5X1-1]
GINSILAVEFVEEMNQRLGIDLGIEVMFDYRGPRELAEFICKQYGEETQPKEVSFSYKEENHQTSSIEGKSSDIAIIGISGKFAGSENIEEFWNHIQSGKSCVEEINRKGWNESKYYDSDPSQKNKSISKWGGFLEDIYKFDALFFNISPLEAERMDPQQRLFLQEAYKAFEDGGYSNEQLSGKKVGVFVGGRSSDYKEKALLEEEVNSQTFLGNDMAILASRISYFMNFKGPSIAVDTACSSSLVSIHLACESIRKGESEIALAGGVFVLSSPEFYLMTSKTNMLSPEGKCKTFDDAANGIVIGEGIGVVVLKQLDEAIKDKDHIYGIIKGSAINQDGKTKGITAPSTLSQKALIYEAYKNSSIDPETIGYIEAHGTGTKLGDPIEFKALTQAFRMFTDKTQFCAIGSHKPNFGHTIMSAGIAGVFKVLMAMKYKKIPPTINIKEINKHIEYNESPFFINTQLREWKRVSNIPLRAGVSSFGFSGMNCHVIIEEPPIIQRKKEGGQDKPYYIFPFSAKKIPDLNQKIIDMAKWLEREGENHSIEDISYTLWTGRSHYSVRCAFIAKDINELKEIILKFINNEISENYLRGEGNVSLKIDSVLKENGDRLIRELQDSGYFNEEEYKEKLLVLSNLYVKQYNLNWRNFFHSHMHRRIPLPTYPFNGDRYWLPEIEGKQTSDGSQVSSINPLLHQNTSNLSEQRFSSTFTGREFFLADHVVNGHKTLPGVAYLEMARAAIKQATEAMKDNNIRIRLKNVVWAQPIVVDDQPVQVHIGIYPKDNGEIVYKVYSDSEEELVVHSQGSAILHFATEVPTLNLTDIRNQCNQTTLSSSQCYEVFQSMGFNYGLGHQGIDKVYVGAREIMAKISLPSVVSNKDDLFDLHPSLMDSALQVSLILMMYSEDAMFTVGNKTHKPFLPFALQEIEIFGKCTSVMWSVVRYSTCSKAEDRVQKLDIDLCDEQGNVCVRMKGFSSRVLEVEDSSVEPSATHGTLILRPDWKEQAIDRESSAPNYVQHMVMLCELNEGLQERIEMHMNDARCLT